MARQKATSRAAAQPAVKKKWTGLRGAAKNSAKNSAKSSAKTSARTSARKTITSKGRGAVTKSVAKPKARPKQRIAVSHHREEDFKSDGLRAYARYRDLGIKDATHGAAQAHVIRLIGPCDPAEVSKLHYHHIEFQMVYVLKGWVKTYMEGQGELLMKEGGCWTQPPKVRHMILDYSDDVELLEVILPGEFKTVELKA